MNGALSRAYHFVKVKYCKIAAQKCIQCLPILQYPDRMQVRVQNILNCITTQTIWLFEFQT